MRIPRFGSGGGRGHGDPAHLVVLRGPFRVIARLRVRSPAFRVPNLVERGPRNRPNLGKTSTAWVRLAQHLMVVHRKPDALAREFAGRPSLTRRAPICKATDPC